MRQTRLRSLASALILASLAGLASPALAQDAKTAKDDQLLKDFIHYIRIDRTDLAGQFGKALLAKVEAPFGTAEAGKGMTIEAFVAFVDSTGELARFEQATSRGQRTAAIADVSQKLNRAYEAGKLSIARNVEQIQASITQLTGSQRQRLLARERLVAAGEYAAPLLLQTLERGSDASRSAEVRQVLTDLGRQAVAPLTAALPKTQPAVQETICAILAQIPSPVAVPTLYQLSVNGKTKAVQEAAKKAIVKLTGGYFADADLSAAFTSLADAYAAKQDALISFSKEITQPVWSYAPQTGLVAIPVKTEVYFPTMAMITAKTALDLSASNEKALTTWLSSNIQRELDTPKDYKHPIFAGGEGSRDSMFYAIAAGPAASQRILARAIDNKNTPVARKAIAAIEKTAGSANLTADVDGRRPLLQTLMYPSRRAQAEAALTLAIGQPQTTFDGAERVIPVLGSLIREAGSKYAVILSDQREKADSIAAALKSKGWTVLPSGRNLGDVENAIAETAGVDLIVLALPSGPTAESLKAIKGNVRLAATPVLAGLSSQGRLELGGTYDGDPLVKVTGDTFAAEPTTEAVKQLLVASGGDMTADDVAAYQLKALAALRDLAIGGSTVFNVADATVPLATALGNSKGTLKLAIAETLCRIADKRAQMALMDATLASSDTEQVALLGKVADSAKKFGNLLEDRQLKRLFEMSNKGGDEQATAVAALIGALNLEAGSVTGMITSMKIEAQPAASKSEPKAEAKPEPKAEAKPAPKADKGEKADKPDAKKDMNK